MTQHVFNNIFEKKKNEVEKYEKIYKKIWKLFSPRFLKSPVQTLLFDELKHKSEKLYSMLIWQAVKIYLLFFNGILNVRKSKKRLKSRISFGSVNKLISPSMPLENTPQMEIRYHNCGLLYNRRQPAYLIPLKFFLYGSDIKHWNIFVRIFFVFFMCSLLVSARNLAF